jgi:hypothetical protein
MNVALSSFYFCCFYPLLLVPVQAAYFTVQKDSSGTYWFGDPNGNKWISRGVVNIPALYHGGDYATTILKENGGSRGNAYNSIWNRMDFWGFNTIGAYVYERANYYKDKPWFHCMGFEGAPSRDYWSDAFLKDIDSRSKTFFATSANDSSLIGMSYANEMRWGSSVDKWPVIPEEDEVLLFHYLNLTSPGFDHAVDFLKAKYKTISALNWAWLIDAASFETIGQHRPFLLPSLERRQDADDFMVIAAEQFFSASLAAVRRYDSFHLTMGVRYSYLEMPSRVVALEAKYSEVSTFNGYWWYPGFDIRAQVENIHSLSGNPVLITEFGWHTAGTIGCAGMPVATKAEAVSLLKTYMPALMSSKYTIGYHMWRWVDDYEPGSYGCAYGLVDVHDKQYTDYVNAFQDANSNAYGWHSQAHLAAQTLLV